MLHCGAFRVSRIDEVELNHELAAIAYAEAQGVLTAIEAFEGCLSLVVPEESSGPSFGRTEHIGVGESAAEHYHVHIVESLASRHEVGHMHILHVETGQIERIGHLAVAVHTFLSDVCSANTTPALTTQRNAARCEFAVDAGGEAVAYRLLLIVFEALGGKFLTALTAVHKI